MSSCTTCLIKKNKLGHSHVPGDGFNLLAEIVVNQDLDFSNKFESPFLFRTVRMRLRSWCTIVITIRPIELISNLLHCSWIDTQTLWNVCIGTFGINARQHSMPFRNFWRSELCHGAAFLKDSAQLTLICCTVDKTKKPHAGNNWFKFSTIYTSHPLCVYIYIYIYIYVSSPIYQPLRSGRIWHKVNF